MILPIVGYGYPLLKKRSVNIDKKLVEVNSTDAIDMGVVTSLLDEQGYTVVESN